MGKYMYDDKYSQRISIYEPVYRSSLVQWIRNSDDPIARWEIEYITVKFTSELQG